MEQTDAAKFVMNTSDTGERGKDTLPDVPHVGQSLEPNSSCFSITPTADDLNRLHQLCWLVVREPLHAAMTFRLAHCVMETICRWQPHNGAFLSGLALAQYRMGEYQTTLDTLARSEEFIPGTPMSLAFQAMARYHLGDENGSRGLLRHLQQVMLLPPWHNDSEASGFLREAQTLILAKATSKR
jgi:hypothetical protein